MNSTAVDFLVPLVLWLPPLHFDQIINLCWMPLLVTHPIWIDHSPAGSDCCSSICYTVSWLSWPRPGTSGSPACWRRALPFLREPFTVPHRGWHCYFAHPLPSASAPQGPSSFSATRPPIAVDSSASAATGWSSYKEDSKACNDLWPSSFARTVPSPLGCTRRRCGRAFHRWSRWRWGRRCSPSKFPHTQ